MIGINSIVNSNAIQFKAKASTVDAQTAKIEERMNKLFGVNLDTFTRVITEKQNEQAWQERMAEIDDPNWDPSI
ncbi:hypothetical protein IJI31_03735 [bacterium]|nr:hypothetical protein [bacterium]